MSEQILYTDQAAQVALWDEQHAQRGSIGLEAHELRDTPSDSAVCFEHALRNHPSHILEIGCAHGRDARYWASQGHLVTCADFSSVALGQLNTLAIAQGVRHLLVPTLHDISSGELPSIGDGPLHGFFARSALHVGDEVMMQIAQRVNERLMPGGLVLIEGKGAGDHKIQRSIPIGGSLMVDTQEHGHLRRVWTEDFARTMCDTVGWHIEALDNRQEQYKENTIDFLRFLARKP